MRIVRRCARRRFRRNCSAEPVEHRAAAEQHASQKALLRFIVPRALGRLIVWQKSIGDVRQRTGAQDAGARRGRTGRRDRSGS